MLSKAKFLKYSAQERGHGRAAAQAPKRKSSGAQKTTQNHSTAQQAAEAWATANKVNVKVAVNITVTTVYVNFNLGALHKDCAFSAIRRYYMYVQT